MTVNFRLRVLAVTAAVAAAVPLAHCSSSTDDSSDSGVHKKDGGSSKDGSVSGDDDSGPSGDDTTPGGDDSGPAGDDDSGHMMMGVDGGSCPPNESSITKYASAAAPLLSALNLSKSDPIPGDGGDAPPSGWNYYAIDGAICRDGSPLGIYVRQGSMKKLMIYLEGGGLCFSDHFCDHNPANMHQQFSADPQTMGETLVGSLSNLSSPTILQKPWSTGIFDITNADNPVKDWSQVYVPYCTGDAHFGTIDKGQITDFSNGMGSPGGSGLGATNNPGYHFVGFNNMQKIAGHLAATFTGLDRIMLTGASAGGLGAVFNATMVAETFGGKVPATVIIDSAAGFPDTKYMSACLQNNARTTYGWTAALPSDCAECTKPDGSGLMNIVKYLHNRYPQDKLGLMMSIHDQIFRLFFGSGMGADPSQPQNCDTNDPNPLAGSLGGVGALFSGFDPTQLRYPASLWEEGLGTLRTTYDCTGAFSSYFIGNADPSQAADMKNPTDTLHMHSFRDRFYDKKLIAGGKSPAEWEADLLNGQVEDLGP